MKNNKYRVACQPDSFYGAVAETGGRIAAGFIALLLTLATLHTEAAAGFDDLPDTLRRAAVAHQLSTYYFYISVGSRRAISSTLRRAAGRICTLSGAEAQPSRRARRYAFRGRPLTRTQLLTHSAAALSGSRFSG